MPEGVLALGVVPLVKFDCCIGVDRVAHIDSLIIYRSGQTVGSETRADALGYLVSSCSFGKLLNIAIRKSDFNHNVYLSFMF